MSRWVGEFVLPGQIPHPENALNAADRVQLLVGDRRGDVHDGIGVLALGLVGQVLHVDLLVGKDGGNGAQQAGAVAVDNAQPGRPCPRKVGVGEVDAVVDNAALQIIPQLLGRHDGAVVLALGGGGPQVGG